MQSAHRLAAPEIVRVIRERAKDLTQGLGPPARVELTADLDDTVRIAIQELAMRVLPKTLHVEGSGFVDVNLLVTDVDILELNPDELRNTQNLDFQHAYMLRRQN